MSSLFRRRMIRSLPVTSAITPKAIGMMTKIGQKKMSPPAAREVAAQMARVIPTGPASMPKTDCLTLFR